MTENAQSPSAQKTIEGRTEYAPSNSSTSHQTQEDRGQLKWNEQRSGVVNPAELDNAYDAAVDYLLEAFGKYFQLLSTADGSNYQDQVQPFSVQTTNFIADYEKGQTPDSILITQLGLWFNRGSNYTQLDDDSQKTIMTIGELFDSVAKRSLSDTVDFAKQAASMINTYLNSDEMVMDLDQRLKTLTLPT
jgi:hypothetical protein